MSAAAIVVGIYQEAGVPQPLLRRRESPRVSAACLGAGIEAASIGARRGTFIRRERVEGVDIDISSCYPVANALCGAQDFLTHEVKAHHVKGERSIHALRRLLETPDASR